MVRSLPMLRVAELVEIKQGDWPMQNESATALISVLRNKSSSVSPGVR
jgi:hypothetical protein